MSTLNRPIHFQFKISNLMLIMLLVCFAASIVGVHRRCSRLEKELKDNVYITEMLAKDYTKEVVEYRRRLEAIENYRERPQK